MIISACFCHLPEKREWQENEVVPAEYLAICSSFEELGEFILSFPIGSVFDITILER